MASETTTTAPGHFGPYGGRFVPEALTAALDGLDAAFVAAMADPAFHAELEHLQRTYTGRPSPLTEAVRFGQSFSSAVFHPLGILVFLAIQWFALVRRLLGLKTSWRGRSLAPQ